MHQKDLEIRVNRYGCCVMNPTYGDFGLFQGDNSSPTELVSRNGQFIRFSPNHYSYIFELEWS